MTSTSSRSGDPDQRARDARAFAFFKDVIELSGEERAARLAVLAADDAAVHAAVVRLIARDEAESSALAPGGGEQILAADLLVSMIARGEVSAEPEPPPMPERIGPYRIVGVLGRGGMGVVYEGEQAEPHRRVAIKTTHAWLAAADNRERFAFEMQALASLRHRSIPRLFEVRQDAGQTWMVMELVRGVPITQYAAGLAVHDRVTLFLEVLDGVAHAHEAGIGHRDLKPHNILVADGQPRILDFGLAASLAPASEGVTVGAGFDGVAGTLGYMAPEQLEQRRDRRVVDHRADVYALGVILHELVTGRLPVVPRSLGEALQLKRQAARPEAAKTAGVGVDLDWILARAMAPEPADRYQDVRTFAADLGCYLGSLPVSARPATALYRLGRWLTRHRGQVRGVFVTLGLVALVLGAIQIGATLGEASELRAREAAAAARLAQLEARQDELDAHGHAEEADRLFQFFASMADNVGTRALHDAWLRDATRHRRRGQRELEIAAYASAYTTAVDAAQRRQALLVLGEAFAADGHWLGVEQVVARLTALGDAGSPHARGLAVHALAYRRDFAGAAAVARAAGGEHDPRLAALEALATAEPLGEVTTAAFIDQISESDASGPRIVVANQAERRLVTFAIGDAEGRGPHRVKEVKLPDDILFGRGLPDRVPGLGAGPLWLIGSTRAGTTRVFVQAGDGFETLATFSLGSFSRALGWREADGSPRLVLGTAGADRRLATWSPERLDITVADPATIGPPSDIDAIVGGDLDGDGARELVVAAGAWSTYELQVLRVDEGGAVRALARRRFGSVSQLALLPRAEGPPLIVVVKSDRYPSPALLGPASPYGAAAGIYLFAWDGVALVERAHVPMPRMVAPDISPHSLIVGDFDGDGRSDLAIGVVRGGDEVLMFMLQVAPLEFEALAVAGMNALAAAQLDADRADELVVRLADDGHRGYVLGLGGVPTPQRPAPATASARPRERWLAGADAALAEVWSRADELEAMGLEARAAATLEAAGPLAADRTNGARFMLRAAELHFELGSVDDATRLYVAARDAGGPELARRAGLGAARSRLEAHDVEAALGHFAALFAPSVPGVADGDVGRSEADAIIGPLAALVGATPGPRGVIGDGRIAPEWHIDAGLGVRWEPGSPRKLRVESFGAGRLMTLPVHFPGGRLALAVELALEHLEIGAGLRIGLKRPDRPGALESATPHLVYVEVWGMGGGAAIERAVSCGPWEGHLAPGEQRERPITAPDEHLRLTVDHLAAVPGTARAETRCVIDRLDDGGEVESLVRRTYDGAVGPALERGDYLLTIEGLGESGWQAALRARVVIARITLTGLTPRAVAPGALATAHRAAFEGEREKALASYVELAGRQSVAAAIGALATELELGRFDAARARVSGLGEVLGSGAAGAWGLVRSAPEVLGPLVYEVSPAVFVEAFGRAWSMARRYLDDAGTQRMLGLAAIGALAGETEAELDLVVAATRLDLQLGEPGRALARAERALGTARPPSAAMEAREAELTLLAAAAADALDRGADAREYLLRWLESGSAHADDLAILSHRPETGALVDYFE